MRRACLITTPPLGCAQYNLDHFSVVSSGVEIVGVKVNGLPVVGLLPIVVRDGGNDTASCRDIGPGYCTPAAAADLLNGLTGVSTAKSLTVQTTHQLSPGQSSNCLSLGGIANCGEEDFVTTF
jgi:hypothetical protein